MHLWGVPPHAPNMQIWGQYAREARHFMSRPPYKARHANVWGLMHKRSSLVFGTFLMLYYYILPNNRSWAWLTSLSNGVIHVCVHCTNVNTMTPPKMSILGG